MSFPRELTSALSDWGSQDWASLQALEAAMVAPFQQPDPSRRWRDGCAKSCFNYLLLDPRVTQDLPVRCVLSPAAGSSEDSIG